MITAAHIRYARTTQLESFTGITANTFSSWTHSPSRHMSGRTQEVLAERLGLSKLEFIKGWDERREDAETIRKYQEELDAIIQSAAKAIAS